MNPSPRLLIRICILTDSQVTAHLRVTNSDLQSLNHRAQELISRVPYPSVLTSIKKTDKTQASVVRLKLLSLYSKAIGTLVFIAYRF